MWFFYAISVDNISIVMYIISIETQKKRCWTHQKELFMKKQFDTWEDYARHLMNLKSTTKTDKHVYKWSLENNENPFTRTTMIERIKGFEMDEEEAALKDQFDREVSLHLYQMMNGNFPDGTCKEINEAKSKLATKILDSETADGKYPLYPYNFYFKNEAGTFTTVFNETNDAWFEDFETLAEALEYLEEDAEPETELVKIQKVCDQLKMSYALDDETNPTAIMIDIEKDAYISIDLETNEIEESENTKITTMKKFWTWINKQKTRKEV